jgi:uncharacterized protein (DUF983 family)
MTSTEKKALRAKLDAQYKEAIKVVATGICPTCGTGIKQNLSITGWWQCKQLGAETHRMDPTRPSCNWQTFTA